MNFRFHGRATAGLRPVGREGQGRGTALDREDYLELEKPSEQEPVRYYASVENGLYDAILNMCAEPGKMCMSEMMHMDTMGGAGSAQP